MIGWGAEHRQNLIAAEELAQEGIGVEVIDLRSLYPLDRKTIVSSVNKTGRCVISHEAPLTQGFGAEIVAILMEESFLHLEAPVMRCAGLDTPFPHTLEEIYLPDSQKVKKAILQVIHY